MPQSRECSQSPHFGTPHSPSIGLGPAQPRLLLEMPQSRECSQSPHFGTPHSPSIGLGPAQPRLLPSIRQSRARSWQPPLGTTAARPLLPPREAEPRSLP